MPPSALATWPAAILINFSAPHGTRLLQNGHQAGPPSGRCLGLKHHLRVNPPASQAEIVSGQASSLPTGRSWTPAHVHGPAARGEQLMDDMLATRNASLSRSGPCAPCVLPTPNWTFPTVTESSA
jgi:hypothetical protein